jgi:hypothetical protein
MLVCCVVVVARATQTLLGVTGGQQAPSCLSPGGREGVTEAAVEAPACRGALSCRAWEGHVAGWCVALPYLIPL